MDRRVVAQLFDSIDLLTAAISEDEDIASRHNETPPGDATATATPEAGQHPVPSKGKKEARVILIVATNK